MKIDKRQRFFRIAIVTMVLAALFGCPVLPPSPPPTTVPPTTVPPTTVPPTTVPPTTVPPTTVPPTQKVSDFGIVAQDEAATTYNYFLYRPEIYTNASYPIVLFLHGAGERGNSLSALVLKHGPLKGLYASGADMANTLAITPTEFSSLNVNIQGSFVLVPQVPSGGWWDKAKLKTLLDATIAANPAIDTDRIYITGLSMGGGGCWDFVRAYPTMVAAAIPICGASSTGSSVLLDIPLWTFHAFNDTTVAASTNTIKILNDSIPGTDDILAGYPNAGGNAGTAAATDQTRSWASESGFSAWTEGISPPPAKLAFTFYRSGGHDSWTRTYANPEVWTWLFAQQKN